MTLKIILGILSLSLIIVGMLYAYDSGWLRGYHLNNKIVSSMFVLYRKQIQSDTTFLRNMTTNYMQLILCDFKSRLNNCIKDEHDKLAAANCTNKQWQSLIIFYENLWKNVEGMKMENASSFQEFDTNWNKITEEWEVIFDRAKKSIMGLDEIEIEISEELKSNVN